jgi:hypothetical protein
MPTVGKFVGVYTTRCSGSLLHHSCMKRGKEMRKKKRKKNVS